jgi:hypothetical protein
MFREEIVHIVPLGWEIDRAVKPFEKHKANRIYLLSALQSDELEEHMLERQRYFTENVKTRLEERGIEQIVSRNMNPFRLLDVMGMVSQIILEEQKRGSHVYVNISAAGRLTSLGAGLAAMAHGVKSYYVVADGYSQNRDEENAHGLSICRQLKMQQLPNFNILLPKRESLIVLAELTKVGRPMKPKQLLRVLNTAGVNGFQYEGHYDTLERGAQSNLLMKLNNRILRNLQEDEYIERERQGRFNMVKITVAGRHVAHISGLLSDE